MKNQIYDTALYLRLSVDDGDKQESDGISNQRTLLQNYLKGCVIVKDLSRFGRDFAGVLQYLYAGY